MSEWPPPRKKVEPAVLFAIVGTLGTIATQGNPPASYVALGVLAVLAWGVLKRQGGGADV